MPKSAISKIDETNYRNFVVCLKLLKFCFRVLFKNLMVDS